MTSLQFFQLLQTPQLAEKLLQGCVKVVLSKVF